MFYSLAADKKSLIFLIFALFLTFFLLAFLRVTWLAYENSILALEVKNQEFIQVQQQVEELSYLQKQKDKLLEDIRILVNRYKLNLTGGYPLIHLNTDDLDLSLDSITPYPVEKNAYFSKLQIDLKISGSYLSILKYIESLESLPAVIEIFSSSFTLKEDNLVSSTLTLNIYSLDTVLEKENSENNKEILTGLGKYDIFTPLVQVLIPKDLGEKNLEEKQVEKENSHLVTDLEENHKDFSQFPVIEEKIEDEPVNVQENELETRIYYHFPSR